MPMMLPASEARRRLADGATLVDIRTRAEFRREHVPGSLNVPADLLDSANLPPGPLLFTCRSGARTAGCADRIAARWGPEAMILDGGLMAWRSAGGAVLTDRSQPIDIMRQVQIVAGSLVLLGLALGLLASPGFLGLSAFVGAGLVFAGATGWCGMARVLALMPWNRANA